MTLYHLKRLNDGKVVADLGLHMALGACWEVVENIWGPIFLSATPRETIWEPNEQGQLILMGYRWVGNMTILDGGLLTPHDYFEARHEEVKL